MAGDDEGASQPVGAPDSTGGDPVEPEQAASPAVDVEPGTELSRFQSANPAEVALGRSVVGEVIAGELVERGPVVLDEDSWELAPPVLANDNYQGRRRAKPASRATLVAAVVVTVAVLAVSTAWALTLGGSGGATDAPPFAAGSDVGASPSTSSSSSAAGPSLLPVIGASPLHSPSTELAPTPTPAPTPAPTPTTPRTPTLLSAGRPTATSALENHGLGGANAVDGNPTTRWGSAWSDPQWISVDLGSVCAVSRVRLSWEAAYGRSYEIQASTDNTNWTTVYTTSSGDGGIDDVMLTGSARWVRVFGIQRATPWGYSLWELEVYGLTP